MRQESHFLGFMPPAAFCHEDAVLQGFLSATEALGLQLYPAQEEAILELMVGKNVILNTPTGSGKSWHRAKNFSLTRDLIGLV